MLAVDWKETVTVMSDKVFPGLSRKIDEKLMSNEVLSNLPLQMALYFNVVFFPVWFVITCVFLYDRFNCFNELYKFILVTVIVAVYLIEIFRLYLGYDGNLRDKIPELAGFWMISTLIQLPLQGFLLFNPYFNLRPLEIVTQSVMFLLLVAQLIAGYFALRHTARTQTAYSRITHMRGTDIRKEKYKTS